MSKSDFLSMSIHFETFGIVPVRYGLESALNRVPKALTRAKNSKLEYFEIRISTQVTNFATRCLVTSTGISVLVISFFFLFSNSMSKKILLIIFLISTRNSKKGSLETRRKFVIAKSENG